jgi:DNA-binding transcriptional MerR regulator
MLLLPGEVGAMSAQTFSIRQAADAAGLTAKTIRYYEQIGLIPRARRTNGGANTNGRRIYIEPDLGRLRFIRQARLLGLSLADVRELVALAEGRGCPSGQPEYQRILTRHLRDIDDRVRHLAMLRTAIKALLAPNSGAIDQACSWATCDCMRPADRGPRVLDKGRG